MKEIRILLVDDHKVITDGLSSLLSQQPGLRISATASNGLEALDVLKVLTVDIVLMDIDMPVMNGLDAMRHLKKIKNSPKVIMLSMHAEKGMVEELIKIGVDGYLLKNAGREEIVSAIHKVITGEKYFTADVTLSLLSKDNRSMENTTREILTDREQEILVLITEGYTNKEIGDQLFISHRTVDTHRTNMMRKLDVNNLAGLISYAIKNKLI